MSDSDEDYMSDKLLVGCQEDIRPGLVFNPTTKRKYELEKKRQEIQAKKPKNSKEREEELRQNGLNTAISSDNKGFKLLQKMGFKQGEGLGKSKSGITEPIKIELKSGKSGVGLQSHFKEKVIKKKEMKDNNLDNKINVFKTNNKMKQAQRNLFRDLITAQKACEDLDSRKQIEPMQEYFWTRETIKRRRDIQDEEEEEAFNEEFQEYFTEENLFEIIHYLRSKHLYCMFCAFIATDKEDLEKNCPGPDRSDHDDD